MGAAVDQRVDRAVRVAVHDDRGIADIGDAEITGVRHLGLEPEKIPCRAAKDPLLLALVSLGIVIKAVGHAAVIQARPDRSIQHPDPPHIPRQAPRARSSASGAMIMVPNTTARNELPTSPGFV